jgi:TrkA family protein
VVAISSLLLVVAVSLLLTRVATVILIATGMSREAARFQARSAFSTAGFTTRESEDVVNHPVRRRVVMNLMLLGSAGTVAVITTLILGLNHHGSGRPWWRILELVIGLLALVYISRSRWVDRRLTSLIRSMLRRFTSIQIGDLASLLDLAADYTVSELSVADGDWVAGHRLGELHLRDEGAVVLGMTRPNGHYVPAPTARTQVAPGDVLVVYGRCSLLAELDNRRAGRTGDQAHLRAVTDQQRLDAAESHETAA